MEINFEALKEAMAKQGVVLTQDMPKSASVSAVVIRKDGTTEDLGMVASWHRNPFIRWYRNINIWWNERKRAK